MEQTKPQDGALIRFARRFKRDEDGQSLILGVLSVFMVLFFVSMILNVGEVTARRIQLQVAADSATYSATTLQAQMLNAISMINTAIAQVRTRALRYTVDVNAYGVLAELRDRVLLSNDTADEDLANQISTLQSQLATAQQQLVDAQAQQPPDPNLIAQLQNQILTLQQQIDRLTAARQALHVGADLNNPIIQPDPASVVDIVGMDGVDALYEDAYTKASQWVPASNEWIKELSRLEHTLAILAPRLAAETGYDMAKSNGGKYASVFPTQRWKPRDESYDAWTVEKLGDQWWRVSQVSGNTVIEAKQEDCGNCTACTACGSRDCVNCWSFNLIDGASVHMNYKLCDLGTNANDEHLWLVQNLLAPAGSQITCITQTAGWVIVRWGPQGLRLIRHDDKNPPWLELVQEDGEWPQNTIFIRHFEGTIQQAAYKWENGQWVMPTEDDFQQISVNTLNLGGVQFNVNFDPSIALPGSARIWVTQPPWFERSWRDEDGNSNRIRIHFSDPISMDCTIAGMHLWVKEEQFGIGRRGHILTVADADGIPRKFYDRAEEYWWQHQLTPEAANKWLYEYKEFGAMLQFETNISRLMAFRDIERSGVPDPSVSEWADAAAVPSWAYDSDANPTGWLNAWSGRLQPNDGAGDVTVDESPYAYYQKRPCWFCKDGTGQPTGYLEVGDRDGDGVPDQVPCPICQGKTYVVISAKDAFDRYGRGSRMDPLPPMPAGQAQRQNYQETNLDSKRLPIVLSEEFFKFGTTIGVWRSREQDLQDSAGNPANTGTLEYLLHDPEAGLKGILRPQDGGPDQPAGATATGPVYYPGWGYFTIAAGRCRLRNGSTYAALIDNCRFEDLDAREHWVADNMYNLYLIRNNRGGGNAAYNYWDARMISIDRQVLTDDAIMGVGDPAQTGTAWLVSLIARGAPWGWTASFDGSGVAEVGGLLTGSIRPRHGYPRAGQPYTDASGAHRDPFIEQLVNQPQGNRRLGGQLLYKDLDSKNVWH